jgi:tRNA (guanosine-2'-O-)-methyltransferase
MHGMVQSLNISVACAVSLYEAQRQRNVKGFYEQSRLAQNDFEQLRTEWMNK